MKKLLSFIIILYAENAISQVGINTENPLQILHIDGKNDNASNTILNDVQSDNDFVVSLDGNVGIGTYNPSLKLDINTHGSEKNPLPGFKLVDGNQAKNRALISDANGVGTWKSVAMSFFTKSFAGAADYILPANTGTGTGVGSVRYTGQSIELPPGKWAINIVLAMEFSSQSAYTKGSNFVRLRLMDDTKNHDAAVDGNISSDAVIPKLASTSFSHSMDRGTLNGMLVIDNKSNGNKTYYFHIDNAASTGAQPSVTVHFGWNESFLSYYEIN